MLNKYSIRLSWNLGGIILVTGVAILQGMRWLLYPQGVDIYYHLLTSWGFIMAGGYSGWDFWQYAPLGRVHIYPPFFHIIIASLLKLGIDGMAIAKIMEMGMPVLFLLTLWYFSKKHYDASLAFFTLLASLSSFSFYLSLMSNLPATLAVILGILAFDQFLRNRLLRASLLMALCFYTHIGMSWIFASALFLYGLSDIRGLKRVLCFILPALILAIPVILKQIIAVKLFDISQMQEKFFCELKIMEYILAIGGLLIICRRKARYLLFLALFSSSFILLPLYPYRFFSAQGFLPVIFISAVFLDAAYKRLKARRPSLLPFYACVLLLLLIVSPTLLQYKDEFTGRARYKLYFCDSAIINLLFVDYSSNRARFVTSFPWCQDEYIGARNAIWENTDSGDIIYSSFNNLGLCLSAISGRATANALLSEIHRTQAFDPFSVSRIIIIDKTRSREGIEGIVGKYKLVKLGENGIFFIYKNPLCSLKSEIRKAVVSFKLIYAIAVIALVLFFFDKRICGVAGRLKRRFS